jgi:hypothetical protein
MQRRASPGRRACQPHASGVAYVPPVRWDELFEDLVAQAAAARDAELFAHARERSRDEAGRQVLEDRLVARCAGPLSLDLVDGDTVRGALVEAGSGWLCIAAVADMWVVPVAALAGIRAPARPPDARNARPRSVRMGLRPVLRGLARRQLYVQVGARGGRTWGGTLDGVGADHVELAEHPADLPRRCGEVRSLRMVPLGALLWVRYASG